MDPASSAADRRELRQKYRSIDEKARSRPEVLAAIYNGELKSTIKAANELHEQVVKPREGVIDAGLFCTLTKVAHQAADKLVTHQQGRSTQEFINALRHNHVGGSDPQVEGEVNPCAFQWGELGAQVAHYFKPAPGVSCMLGPMDVQSKVRQVVARQNRRPTGEAVRPEELHAVQEHDKQETDHTMEEMWQVLKQLSQSPVAELVCNHKCFAQTIENLFALSFLARDQRVYLWHDPQQGMMARVVEGRASVPQVPGKRPDEQLQFVMSLTMGDWEQMKQVVQPAHTKMPHRDQSGVAAPNARGSKRQQRQQQQGPDEAGPSSASAPAPHHKRSRA